MINLLVLLAEGGRSDKFVKGFREGTLAHTPLHVILWLAVVALAIATICYMVERFKASRREGAICHEGKLFRDLCRLHRLNYGSARLLRRMAREHKLRSVCDVFVRPELFQSRAEATLKAKLFGTLSP